MVWRPEPELAYDANDGGRENRGAAADFRSKRLGERRTEIASREPNRAEPSRVVEQAVIEGKDDA